MQELLSIPARERDAAWYRQFEEALLQSAAPAFDGAKVFEGPDGLPYYHFPLPAVSTAQDFKSFLAEIAELGCGVVLDARNGPYVLHYGDVWSLHEYGYIFKPREEAVAEEIGEDPENKLSILKVAKTTRIMVACPSDHYLPPYVKKSIQSGLGKFGAGQTGVASVYIRDLNPRQNLVFSLKREEMPQQNYQKAMHYLAWSIPKHYGLLWNEIEDDTHSHLVADEDFYPLV